MVIDQTQSEASIKRRCSQWMLVTGIVSLASLGALILFEQASTKIADFVLTPWFAICRNITPASWQVRGNILLFMMWLISGVIVYSMLIGVTVVRLLAIVERRSKPDRSAEVNEQSRGVTHARATAGDVLLFLILFSTLAVFVVFGSDSVSLVATRSTESVLVIEKPRHKRVENTLPVVAVYEGLIRSMKVDKDFHEVTGPTERIIRTQADYEAFVAQIPLHQITKTNPAPPSKDPLLKRPPIDFAKHMVLIAIRPDNMYVSSHIESLVLDGQTLRVHVLDPDPGETRFLNQMRGIGTYRAVVVPQHTGPIQFHRKRGKPTPPQTSFLDDPTVSSRGTFLSRACRARAQGRRTAATLSGSRSPLSPSQRTGQPDMV